MAQVVEHLPRKSEALSSNPNTKKKKKKRVIFYLKLILGFVSFLFSNKQVHLKIFKKLYGYN
jgi:hypothetical protein